MLWYGINNTGPVKRLKLKKESKVGLSKRIGGREKKERSKLKGKKGVKKRL